MRWGQIVWEVGRACPPVPVGVDELAVVLALPNRVPYAVKRLWGGHQQEHFIESHPGLKNPIKNRGVRFYGTSEAIPHEDLVSQRVAQNHAHKLPVPCPLDILAALTAAVGWVILEFKGNPDGLSTCGTRKGFIMSFMNFSHNFIKYL